MEYLCHDSYYGQKKNDILSGLVFLIKSCKIIYCSPRDDLTLILPLHVGKLTQDYCSYNTFILPLFRHKNKFKYMRVKIHNCLAFTISSHRWQVLWHESRWWCITERVIMEGKTKMCSKISDENLLVPPHLLYLKGQVIYSITQL